MTQMLNFRVLTSIFVGGRGQGKGGKGTRERGEGGKGKGEGKGGKGKGKGGLLVYYFHKGFKES